MEDNVLAFTCEGIEDGGHFPAIHTGYGQNLSPAFLLENLSPQAVTLAVVLEDASHPLRNFTHWVIWNLPAAARIAGGIPAGKSIPSLGGAVQGIGYGMHRYAGPKPPRGKTHFYRFTLYALDCRLDLGAGATKKRFLRAAEGHIVQWNNMTAQYP